MEPTSYIDDFTRFLPFILIGGALIFAVYAIKKLVFTEDGGKSLTALFHKGKVGITDIFLFTLAGIEGVTAGNAFLIEMAEGDSYANALGAHLTIAFFCAGMGFISIKEFVDAWRKTQMRKQMGYTAGYLVLQWIVPVILIIIAIAGPYVNLMIIAKSHDQFVLVKDFVNFKVGFLDMIDYAKPVIARSAFIVQFHVISTLIIAIWSVSDDEFHIPKEKKEDKKEGDKKEKKKKEKEKKDHTKEPSWQDSAEYMAKILGVPLLKINKGLGQADDAAKIDLKGRLCKAGWYYEKNQRDMSAAKEIGNDQTIKKIKNDMQQTQKTFEKLWTDIEES